MVLQAHDRAGARILGLTALALVMMSGVGSGVFAQPAPALRAGPSSDAPDAGFETARLAFERLPEADRIAIQDALVWTGDYTTTATGSFGRRTFEAILSYQRRAGQPASGVLDPRSRQGLFAKGAEARGRAGFALLTDPATGIRIGIPQKILTRRSESQGSGSRLQSNDGRITLDLRALDGGEAALKTAYERNLAVQSSGRKVSYHVLRPDFFVLSGETAGGRFYLRYAAGADEVRGFSIGYDKALSPDLDRLVIAIAISFDPFPAKPGVAGSPPSNLAAEAPPVPPQRPGSLGRPDGSGTALVTGLAISPRLVLTSELPETCPEPAVDGQRARIVRQDKAKSLALLETAANRATVPVSFASSTPGQDGMVLFRSAQEGGRPVATPAALPAPGRLVAPLQEGASGGVVLGSDSAVIGLVGTLLREPRAVAGLVPPAPYGYQDAGALRAFLGAEAPTPPGIPAPGRIGFAATIAAITPALAAVTCGGARAP